MRLLLHICCAPCLIGPLGTLRAEGHAVTGFFYNPNIHPLLEFRRRLGALREYVAAEPFPVVCDDEYGLHLFIREVYAEAPATPERCERCYRLRLERIARETRDRALEAFTTTLLVSRHQAHEVVRRTAEEVAARYGVGFLYRDFRPLEAASHRAARRYGLYFQNYCGCIFSEEERFRGSELPAKCEKPR